MWAIEARILGLIFAGVVLISSLIAFVLSHFQ